MAEPGQPNPSPAEPGPRPLPRDRPLGPDEPCAPVDVPPEAPRPSQQYRNLALTAVGTHDLPPTAGYLEGAHNALRHKLGLVKESLEELNARRGVDLAGARRGPGGGGVRRIPAR